MSPTRVVLCFIGLTSLGLEAVTLQQDNLNGGIGRGYSFLYETLYYDDNGDMVRPGFIGDVEVTAPYLGGDPGCCKICRETPHTAGGTTEFFNFNWHEKYGSNYCNCMFGPKKETGPDMRVLGYCGNDAEFLDQVDGSLGEERRLVTQTRHFGRGNLHIFGPAWDEEGAENVNDCCVKCQKTYSGVEMAELTTFFDVGMCDCYKSIPGKRIETYGLGSYVGFCDNQ